MKPDEVDLGQERALAICKILGLDPNRTRSINISCKTKHPVIITAEMYIDINQGDELTKKLKEIDFIPRHKHKCLV